VKHTYTRDIDWKHAQRLAREARLEREGRDIDRDWPDFPEDSEEQEDQEDDSEY
jgi:hypothetical protein